MLPYALLFVAGVLAGYVNTVAGAGSLLTLPALVFSGLDAGAANATNRLAVLAQNIAAIEGYRREGIAIPRAALWLSIPASLTAILGAYLATLSSERTTRLCIAIAMVVFLALSLVKRKKRDEETTLPLTVTWKTCLGFAALGLYAGFLQAGIGVLILLYLTLAHAVKLLDANVAKIVVVLMLTIASTFVFVAFGGERTSVDLVRGVVLGAGTVLGGYAGAKASVKRGEKFVRVVMIVSIVASALKLAWDALR